MLIFAKMMLQSVLRAVRKADFATILMYLGVAMAGFIVLVLATRIVTAVFSFITGNGWAMLITGICFMVFGRYLKNRTKAETPKENEEPEEAE